MRSTNSVCPHLFFLFLACSTLGCGSNPGARQVTPAAAVAPRVVLRHAVVEVHDLSPADLNHLRDAKLTPEAWAAILVVFVAGDSSDDCSGRPPVAGSYAVANEVFTFTPRFPLTAGLRYRVVLDVARIPG